MFPLFIFIIFLNWVPLLDGREKWSVNSVRVKWASERCLIPCSQKEKKIYGKCMITPVYVCVHVRLTSAHAVRWIIRGISATNDCFMSIHLRNYSVRVQRFMSSKSRICEEKPERRLNTPQKNQAKIIPLLSDPEDGCTHSVCRYEVSFICVYVSFVYSVRTLGLRGEEGRWRHTTISLEMLLSLLI